MTKSRFKRKGIKNQLPLLRRILKFQNSRILCVLNKINYILSLRPIYTYSIPIQTGAISCIEFVLFKRFDPSVSRRVSRTSSVTIIILKTY